MGRPAPGAGDSGLEPAPASALGLRSRPPGGAPLRRRGDEAPAAQQTSFRSGLRLPLHVGGGSPLPCGIPYPLTSAPRLAAYQLNASGYFSQRAAPLTDVEGPRLTKVRFLLPYFLVLAVFVGGASIIIDATAGERERDSLEPLLINPVPRGALVVGKLLASLPFAIVAVLTSIVASGALLTLVPLEEFLGIQLTVDPVALAKIFLLCLPMILLAAAIQMIIATFAKTYKEAQTYTNWLPLVPALPGILLTFLPVKPALWTMLIPTFGQQVLINQLLRGEVVATNDVVISTAVTLALALVLTFVAIRLYQREKILFGSES